MNSNRCEVTATALDEAGLGVGTSDGKRVHVADLLPGERAEVAIDHTSPHRAEAWGRIVRRFPAELQDSVDLAGARAWRVLWYDREGVLADAAKALESEDLEAALRAGKQPPQPSNAQAIVSGSCRPPCGWRQRSSASKPSMRPVASEILGW